MSGWAERHFGRKDDPRIVIDEITGYLVAMVAVGPAVSGVIIGFLLFRVFDILKPWPVGLIDKKISGGIGIVMDDVAAGIYAAVLTNILVRFVF